MSLHIGDLAPDFTADTQSGPIRFHAWQGESWVLLFSHPADFTPVCTTELSRVAQLSGQWATRGVKPIALSVDSAEDHQRWVFDIESVAGTRVDFPIVADRDGRVARLYDMLHEGAGDTSPVRSVFVIDGECRIRLTMTYPKSTGRNFDEILRTVDALQTADRSRVATPADWRQGDRVVVPAGESVDLARQRLDEVEEVLPYLAFAQEQQR